MEITFENPSAKDVTLFSGTGEELADLAPFGGTTTIDTLSGTKFFFSKGPDKSEDHVVIVDKLQHSYRFRANCENSHPNCASFSHSCDTNPGWMAVHCPLVCNVCHLQEKKVRCDRQRLNTSSTPAVPDGGIDELFRSLKVDYPNYGVEILSSPDHDPPGPWVATFDTFTTDEEVEAVLKTTDNFKRSTDQGSTDPDTGVQKMVTSVSRTSSNTWCSDKCVNHPKVKQLMAKIASVIKVPTQNFETLQVLNYQLGQYYKTHHDANSADYDMPAGHRTYTMFLYFSDVEEGGETDFPELNISVQPKKGKALLWPSLIDADLKLVDSRTKHQAKPVIKGVKVAANVWAHQYDYTTPNLWGCTGSFA